MLPRLLKRLLCSLLLPLFATIAAAKATDSDVLGEVYQATSRYQDTLFDIARAHNIGYREIRLANPDVDVLLPGEGSPIVIPAEYILPQLTPRRGIVLNLAERRLYYFGNGKGEPVRSYPVGIGREGWLTPTGDTVIKEKIRHPSWYPPPSIREEYAAMGIDLPDVVGPGSDNPLGKYALRLGKRRYLIHGTNRPDGVGMRVSHGCIRLRPESIAQLYQLVSIGTQVHIIDQPIKAGWKGSQLLLEVHPGESGGAGEEDGSALARAIIAATSTRQARIDWQRVEEMVLLANGIPQVIGQAVVDGKD